MAVNRTQALARQWLMLILLALLFVTPLLMRIDVTSGSPTGRSASGRDAPMNYDFKLINETVHVYPKADASVVINYSITFENYGTDFDYIDIGFPNQYYLLSSVTAYWSLNGGPFVQLTSINPSSAIAIGVEIYVPFSQRPGYGDHGTLIVWGTNPHMIYLDTVHAGYVGYEFVPTWFDPNYCRSTDWLGINLHFPTGFFNGTQAFYHHDAYTRYYYGTDSLVYVWEYGAHTPRAILQGISFPYNEAYITTYYTVGFEEWFSQWGPLLMILVAILVFFTICTVLILKVRRSGGFQVSRSAYLPPAVKVEALGICRGLTVVEAAVLNETPLNRVFTMIIFGLLRKGLISLRREGEARPTFTPNPEAIATAASTTDFHYYERLLLKAVLPDGSLDKAAIRTMLNTLIQTTARKLEGFSRTDTKTYYQQMITTAWQQIGKATTPDAQVKALDDYAEWLLLSPDYEARLRPYPNYYVPYWYWFWIWGSHPHPRTLPHPPPTITARGPPPAPFNLTNFANATVLGTQTFANNVVTGFQQLANQIATAFRPPPPRPTYTGARSYGGRSCACACACASCACACAGGGR